MAKSNKHKKDNNNIKNKEDMYIAEETVKSKEEAIKEQDENKEENIEVNNVEKVIDNEAMDAIIEEYNGETKEKPEERRIKIREAADLAGLKKINKKFIIILSSIVLAIIITFTAIAVINKMNDNVYRNVYLNGKNISGMNSLEVADYIKKEQEGLANTSLKIYQGKEEILEIVPSDISFEIDMAKVEDEVFGFGRDSNILKNNFDITFALIAKKEIEFKYKYDVNKLSEIVKEIKESLDNKVIQDSFVVDEAQYKLIITRGKSGNTIEESVVKNQIISSLANKMGEYKLNIIKGSPDELDVDVIYSAVKREAKDAYIDKTTTVYKFIPHQVGLDFDKDTLKDILSKDENKGEEKVIEYPLTVVEPAVKTSDIKWEMYEYKISSFTTHFSTYDANRVNNLRVALELLNGKVIMPGETFSYNSVVGGATAAQGFKPAATFVGGRVTSEVGGGICQTVSTLYNTVLMANLEIVQRKAHSLPVAYVPGSRDATVYYPSIDFKFKNTRTYPIKIVTTFNKNGSLDIALWGTKEENEYVVTISSRTLETIEYGTQYIEDANMEKGKQVVIQSGTNGYKTESYITKKLNGKVVSTTLLSRDTYKAVSQIIKIGTKVVETPAVTPPPVDNSQNNQNNNTEPSPPVTDNTNDSAANESESSNGEGNSN